MPKQLVSDVEIKNNTVHYFRSLDKIAASFSHACKDEFLNCVISRMNHTNVWVSHVCSGALFLNAINLLALALFFCIWNRFSRFGLTSNVNLNYNNDQIIHYRFVEVGIGEPQQNLKVALSLYSDDVS